MADSRPIATTAWQRIDEHGAAVICSWCPDKDVATARAVRAGLLVTHTLCPECDARMRAEAGLDLPPFDGTKETPAGISRAVGSATARRDERSAAAGGSVELLARSGFVAAKAVAAVCGIGDAYRLDWRYRPTDWGCPGDFKHEHDVLFYAVKKLPQLVDALIAAGETDAALRLREALARMPVERPTASPGGPPPDRRYWFNEL